MFDDIFVPVCMYTRFFKRAENFARFTEDFLRPARRAFVAVADDLNAYNFINRGYREQIAFENARTEGANVATMISRIVEKAGLTTRVSVCRWAELTAAEDYRRLHTRVLSAFENDVKLRELLQEFVLHHIRRMGWKRTSSELEWERRYILEEITARVLMTEIRGYSCEIWEKIPGPLDPDPLRDLYARHSDLLCDITDRKILARRLFSLQETPDVALLRAAPARTILKEI